MIHPKKVGHVVLKVRDLQKAEQFYTEVLGFTVVTRLKRPAGVFFTLGEQHHDLAVLAVPPDAAPVAASRQRRYDCAIPALRRAVELRPTSTYAWNALGAASQRSKIDMAEHIKKEVFVRRLAKKMETDEATAEAWLEATLEAMYQVFKSGKGISFAGFGGFYLDRRRESTAFKFNPGQKLRALFGWSSKYKGKL